MGSNQVKSMPNLTFERDWLRQPLNLTLELFIIEVYKVKTWENYEQVARYLLDKFSSEFGLKEVAGKQVVLGSSGANWEIDAKGVHGDGESFVIIECKRYPENRINQNLLAALAYQISDTGAKGGIIVTPIGLQTGAMKIASSENIIEVKLHQDSSYSDYFIEFMGKVILGVRVDLGNVGIQSVKSSATHSVRVDLGNVGIQSVKSSASHSVRVDIGVSMKLHSVSGGNE